MRDILLCSDRCHETMTTDWACFIDEIYITMLWPLSWDDANWRSMIHTLGIYYHALIVVIRQRQLTEHGSYLRNILPCSDRCHETITTDRACFMNEGYITMLLPLSWDDDNRLSMFHSWTIYNLTLTVVMRRWLMEHDSYLKLDHHALSVVIRRRQPKEHVS